MSITTTALLCVIFAASLWQPNAQRLYAALVSSVLTICHHWGCFDTEGLAYYGSAALVDLAIILALSVIDPVPKMALRLQTIAVISIIINLAGWVTWMLYIPPDWYNFAYVLLYTWVLITLLRRGKADHVGGYRNSSRRPCFRFSFSARYILDTQNGGKI